MISSGTKIQRAKKAADGKVSLASAMQRIRIFRTPLQDGKSPQPVADYWAISPPQIGSMFFIEDGQVLTIYSAMTSVNDRNGVVTVQLFGMGQ